MLSTFSSSSAFAELSSSTVPDSSALILEASSTCADKASFSPVRRAMEANEECAVILMFSVSRGGWNMQEKYVQMGKHYDIPMVSVKTGMYGAFGKVRIDEALYYHDDYHPSGYGHELMKDCLMNMVRTVDGEEPSKPAGLPEKDYVGADFKELVMIDSTWTGLDRIQLLPGGFSQTDSSVVSMYFTKEISFPDNFCHKKDASDEPFTVKLNCRNILVNYKTSTSAGFGNADFFVDGELVKTVEGCSSGAWNNCNVIMVLDEAESGEHTLEVRMSEGNEDKAFTVLSIGYTE